MRKPINYCDLRKHVSFTETDLYDFIKSQDHYFKPKLSYKVNLNDYATKLYNLALVNICYNDNKIVGACAFYCNPDVYDYGFLSFLSVNYNYRNMGIAKKMLKEMILHCKQNGMKSLKSSTWKSSIAMGMYLKFGFKANYDSKSERVLLDLKL